MSDDTEDDTGRDSNYLLGISETDLKSGDPETLSLTPQQHETLKDRLHGDRLQDISYSERRYLVIGEGTESGAGTRRKNVCELLERRPNATSFRLEDFGFTSDDLDLWAAAFEILCEQATLIVGILEDFDGGYVWELGYLYRMQTRTRDILWLLKRIYGDEETNREKYDNGMAASHLSQLEEAVSERVVEWSDSDDLPDAVEELP